MRNTDQTKRTTDGESVCNTCVLLKNGKNVNV